MCLDPPPLRSHSGCMLSDMSGLCRFYLRGWQGGHSLDAGDSPDVPRGTHMNDDDSSHYVRCQRLLLILHRGCQRPTLMCIPHFYKLVVRERRVCVMRCDACVASLVLHKLNKNVTETLYVKLFMDVNKTYSTSPPGKVSSSHQRPRC